MNRKGTSLEAAMISVVLFGIAMVVLIIIYKVLFDIGQSQFTEKECQSSLLLTRAVDNVQPFCPVKVSTPVPVKCNRNFVTVNPTSVVRNGNDISLGTDATCPAGNKACMPQYAVAEEMRGCWHQFFEGELVVLQQVEINAAKAWAPKDFKRACYVCSEVTINTTKDVDGFMEYLQKTQIKDGRSYYAYLSSNKAWCDNRMLSGSSPTCWDAMGRPIESGILSAIGMSEGARPNVRPETLKAGQTYAVTFIRRGLGSCDNTPGGGSMTSQHLTNSVQLIPVQQLPQACDVVIV